MNIVTAIRALFQAKNVVGELKPVPKTGFVSSEFWLAIFADALLILGVVDNFVNPNIAIALSVGLKAIYMIVRLMLKLKHVELGKVDGLDDLTPEQIVQLFQTLTNAPAMTVTTTGTAAAVTPSVTVTSTTVS